MQTSIITFEFSYERLGYLTGNPSLVIMYFFELAAFITGLYYWKKFESTSIIWFILFLGYNFLNEVTASTIYIFGWADHTSIFYNVRYPIYFGVYFYLFYQYAVSDRFRQIILMMFGLWCLSYLYFVFTHGIVEGVALFSRVFGGFLLLIVILFFLIEVINNNLTTTLKDVFLVYISIALILNLVVQLPVLTMTYVGWPRVMELNDERRQFFNIIRNASFWVASAMYLIFIYGFYRAKSSNYLMQ
ncbi:MAG: hypothetical protein VYB38_03000 [Bacteroidota bacterium]|nr:hypothetical protein [Bacteroidota bacterium]MEE3147493.1 hypothetical protein [Bacteroidota bacterium]